MITEIIIDETVDEEVLTIDFIDGPFVGMIEADWDLDPGEWLLAWGHVQGPDWLDVVFDMESIDTELKCFDPRFLNELLNAPVVTQWRWQHTPSRIP